MKRLVLGIALFLIVSLNANAATYWVPATADIYLAGQPVGTVISDSMCGTSDSAPGGQAAFETAGLFLQSGTHLTFSASGLAGNGGTVPWIAPDGDATALSSYNPYTGSGYLTGSGWIYNPYANQVVQVPFALSGHSNLRMNSLIGVFTSDIVPQWGTSSSLPPSLDYAQIGLDFLSISPQLRQIFFIGDGITSNGNIQHFVVPQGATHLYLGINDGPGTYVSNPGGFTVEVNSVPEPSSILAILCGIGGLGGIIRLKRR